MMTIHQFLLLKIMEEAAEVQQRCSKAMQFGLHETQPTDPKAGDNLERLKLELNDLTSCLVIARDNGIHLGLPKAEALEAWKDKLAKLNKYLAYSRELGMVEPGEPLA